MRRYAAALVVGLIVLTATGCLARSIPIGRALDEGALRGKRRALQGWQSELSELLRNRTAGGRIANGNDAAPDQFPYVVYLLITQSDGQYVCTGSLISPRAVLTAAHCMYSDSGVPQTKSVDVYTGVDITLPEASYSGVKYWNPGYAPSKRADSMYGDACIISLDSPAPNGLTSLATATTAQSPMETVIGFGETQSGSTPDTLQYVAVPSLTAAQANKFASDYSQSKGSGWSGMERDHIAAGLASDRGDSCEGDSGGPLLNSAGLQVGLTSYGLVQDCGTKINIGFYTSVAYWRTWIDDTLSYNNLAGASPPARLCSAQASTCLTGGSTLKTVSTTTGGLCCEACRGLPTCGAWTWKAKVCQLKKSTGYKKARGACTSGTVKAA